MKIENICFWSVILTFLLLACNKEVEPNFLAGKFTAYYFEVQDCSDTSSNIVADLNFPDSVYVVDCTIDTISCDTFIAPDSMYMSIDSFIIDPVTSIVRDTMFFRLDTVVMDTTIDCLTQLIDCDFIKFNEITFEIDEVGNYEFIIDRVFNGNQEVIVDEGKYYSTGFNDLNLCVTDCLDSLWFPGVFVQTGGDVNVSWRDTISSNCGYLFQGR